MQRAREIEPLSTSVNLYLAVAQLHAGQYDLAIRQLQQSIELDPAYYRTYMFQGQNVELSWTARRSDCCIAKGGFACPGPQRIAGFPCIGRRRKGRPPGGAQTFEEDPGSGGNCGTFGSSLNDLRPPGDGNRVVRMVGASGDQQVDANLRCRHQRGISPVSIDSRFHHFLAQIGLSHLARS